AVSGVLVGSIGPEGAFVLNGLSFMAVLVALIFVRVSTREQPASQASLGANLVEGARYLAGERAILSIIAVMTIVSLFVLPYQTLLPVFARDILQVGAMGLGLLTASAGFGAILGALVVANLSRSRRGMLIMALMLGLSPFTVAFSISRTFWVSCAMLALVSGGIVALKTLGITLIQIQTRDELRGRVTSILLLILGATPRLGGLVAGYLANGLGAPFALGLGALGCLVCGMFALVKFPCIRELP
ncbi:MAG: MFS transporter, partial [Promethearchaeota archaeon]